MFLPRLVISALRGGAGKTILSTGIIAAWARQGKRVAPFKKGPDYIDSGWLALAASLPCYNLDTFLIPLHHITQSFRSHTQNTDIAVIEGNRGLYDGIDLDGSTSTAELAKLLNAPVILNIDCTKSTRTMAAAVLGCIQFDPEVNIRGVILNRVANPRHEEILRKSIEFHCGIPVLGALPKLKQQNFPERHMGLVPMHEHSWAKESIQTIAKIITERVNLNELYRIAEESVGNSIVGIESPIPSEMNLHAFQNSTADKPKVGIIRDSAFQFYYPENIDALVAAGCEVVFISPLTDQTLPTLDALYIGGGFPETHAEELANNLTFRNELKRLADCGLPIYAECGGLMYLGGELVLDEKAYPMSGVLPITFGFSKKPQGHGYTVVNVIRDNPFFSVNTEIRGHEFHYSKVLSWKGSDSDLAFSMSRGAGVIQSKDGVCYKNVLATYTHIHALGTPEWASAMAANAHSYKVGRL